MSRLLVVALFLLLATATPAGAASITTALHEIRFAGDGDEVNDVSVFRVDGRTHVRDEAATIRLVDGSIARCRAIDEHEVTCDGEPPLLVYANAGDDRVRVDGAVPATTLVSLGDGADAGSLPYGRLSGGDGDDDLTGTAVEGDEGADRIQVLPMPHFADSSGRGGGGDDVVLGSPGRDVLSGGPGRDALHGGDGGDRLEDGGAGEADVVHDGGPGEDVVVYEDVDGLRTGGVTIDLAAGTGGGVAERDPIQDVEGARGTSSADVLRGSPGNDTLDGGPGDDLIQGAGGDDVLRDDPGGDDRLEGGDEDDRLDGGPGDDALDGGPGNDVLDGSFGYDVVLGGDGHDDAAGGPWADRIDGGEGDDRLQSDHDFVRDVLDCGPGHDTAVADPGEETALTCERATRRAPRPVITSHSRYPFHLFGRRVTVWGECDPASAVYGGALVVYIGGRLAARGRWACDGATRTPEADVPLALTLRAWAARRVRRGPARAVATFDLGLRDQLETKQRLVLRRHALRH